jgi:predicted amidohydrolase
VHFNPGSHYHCHVDLPFFTVALTSGSELRNAQSTSAFDAPFVPIALVSSALADPTMAHQARLIARQFGLYVVFSNVVGDYRANREAKNFSGQSAIYTRYGGVLGRMDDKSGLGFAELPDIPTRLEGLGNIHFGAKRSTQRAHRWLVRNDTLKKDGFADLV